MIIATELNFEAEVLPASLTTPVLVDFWAPWCTPCKTLIPVLEKLEAEYEGRFILAKVNVDEQPGLAAMFGVRSVPACMLLKEGRTIDGFMGALPEVQVREFLDKHLQPAAPAAQPELADDVLDDEEILERLQNVLAAEPENDNARFDYVKLLLQLGRMEEAQAAFVPAAAKMAAVRKFDSLHRWLQALQAQQQAPADMAALDAAIAANKRDFAARFARAQALMAQQQWTDAMDELLEILMRDKTWDEDKALKTYIDVLDIMEPPRPVVPEGQIAPDDPVVASYRRRLSSVVLS